MFKGLIRRPIAVMMVLIAVMVLGVAAIRKLPVSLVPEVDIPRMTVQVTSPERSAREINELLLNPLRAQLVQVPHLEELTWIRFLNVSILFIILAYIICISVSLHKHNFLISTIPFPDTDFYKNDIQG